MKYKALLSALICFLLIAFQTNAQQLLNPFDVISKKKTTYITLLDGTEVEGPIKSFDRKKGLIEELKIEVDGKKITYKTEEIKHMYLPQSNWDKLGKATEFMNDPRQWNSEYVEQEKMRDGYGFFEQSEVLVKKKKMTLQMQLLNPGFAQRIKIYHDPFAKETMSMGVGGMTLAGGDEKSYYISKDGQTAFRLYKKNYKEEFEKLFADCPAVLEKYGEKMKWSEFNEAVFDHANCE